MHHKMPLEQKFSFLSELAAPQMKTQSLRGKCRKDYLEERIENRVAHTCGNKYHQYHCETSSHPSIGMTGIVITRY